MFVATKTFIYDWFTLVYWVFFKPSALRDHLYQAAPELTRNQRNNRWYLLHSNKILRHFQIRAAVVVCITPFLLSSSIGLLAQAIGISFSWLASINGILSGLFLSLILIFTWGITLGITWGMSSGLTLGIVWTLCLSTAYGIAEGVQNEIFSTILWGLTLGIAGSISVTLESGLSWGLVAGPIVGLVAGLAGGLAIGARPSMSMILIFFMATLIGVVRLPFYLVQIYPALRAYRRASNPPPQKQTHHADDLKHIWYYSQQIERSPVYMDELLMFPQPYLAKLLVLLSRCHLRSGLRHIAYVASNPFQRWAAQRAIRTLLEQDQVPFFLIMHELLNAKQPYHAIGGSEYMHANDPAFTAKIILAETAGMPTTQDMTNGHLNVANNVTDALTSLLRLRGTSPYEPLAVAYLYLLTSTMPLHTIFHRILPIFEAARSHPYGEEICQTYVACNTALRCQYLAEIAQCSQVFEPLLEIETPLRHNIIKVLKKLNHITTDAMMFLSGKHPVNLRDALLKAQGKIEEARQLAYKVSDPEQSIFLEIIEQWRQLFVTEGKQIAEGVAVEVLPNPYVAGRALGPSDGKIFAGRHEIFRQIEETLHTGVTVVLYGQRRIGKTSILLHLKNHLSHTLVPVYFNLQILQAGSTAGLFYSIARAITEHMEKEQDKQLILPTLDTFHIEPFLTFDEFLSEVERSVDLGQRIVLVFDEFEELERQVDAGHVDERIFTFLRGLTQTRHGIVLLFAGLHTLEQMSYDYWHPFFLSVKPIKVAYLSQAEAWGLITSPVDEFPLKYEKAATDRIIVATHRQPFLIQALCFNLITHLNNPLYRSNRTTVKHIDNILEQTIERGTYYFDDYFWGHSTNNEQLALAIVANAATNQKNQQNGVHSPNGGNGTNSTQSTVVDDTDEKQWVSFSHVEKELGRETALNTLKHLCCRDILEERAIGANTLLYRFQVELLQLWVARTKPLARVLLERSTLPDYS